MQYIFMDSFNFPSFPDELTGSSLPVPSPGKGGGLGVGPATPPPHKNYNRYRNVNESKFINSCSGTGRQPTETVYDTL